MKGLEALKSFESVPRRWPLARLTVPFLTCVEYLDRVLAGCCWEVLITRKDPDDSLGALRQAAKSLTLTLASYLADFVAETLRASRTPQGGPLKSCCMLPPQYKVFHRDLCNVKDQTLLCTLIRKLRPSMIWLAPPCGTASKAKDIPAFDHQGNPISLPLRSSDFPDGLPDLPPHQHSRVLAANTLYTLVAKIICLCEDLRIPWKAIRTCGLHQPFDHFQLFHQSPCITACTGGPVQSLPNYSFMVLIFLRYTSCAIILISTYHGR